MVLPSLLLPPPPLLHAGPALAPTRCPQCPKETTPLPPPPPSRRCSGGATAAAHASPRRHAAGFPSARGGKCPRQRRPPCRLARRSGCVVVLTGLCRLPRATPSAAVSQACARALGPHTTVAGAGVVALQRPLVPASAARTASAWTCLPWSRQRLAMAAAVGASRRPRQRRRRPRSQGAKAVGVPRRTRLCQQPVAVAVAAVADGCWAGTTKSIPVYWWALWGAVGDRPSTDGRPAQGRRQHRGPSCRTRRRWGAPSWRNWRKSCQTRLRPPPLRCTPRSSRRRRRRSSRYSTAGRKWPSWPPSRACGRHRKRDWRLRKTLAMFRRRPATRWRRPPRATAWGCCCSLGKREARPQLVVQPVPRFAGIPEFYPAWGLMSIVLQVQRQYFSFLWPPCAQCPSPRRVTRRSPPLPRRQLHPPRPEGAPHGPLLAPSGPASLFAPTFSRRPVLIGPDTVCGCGAAPPPFPPPRRGARADSRHAVFDSVRQTPPATGRHDRVGATALAVGRPACSSSGSEGRL